MGEIEMNKFEKWKQGLTLDVLYELIVTRNRCKRCPVWDLCLTLPVGSGDCLERLKEWGEQDANAR